MVLENNTASMLSSSDVCNDFVEKNERGLQLSRRKFMHVGLSNH